MPGSGLLRTVGTPHVDMAIAAFARDANKPGIAAHLAVLNETSRHVGLDEDLAVLATVRTRHIKSVVHARPFSPSKPLAHPLNTSARERRVHESLDCSRCGGFPDHLRPCLLVTYSLSTRTTASGSRSMTVSRMRAARSGTRRPCSHSCTARASRPNRSANFWRLNFMRFRIARICSAAGSSTMRQGKSTSPRTWARTSPKAASIS